MLCCRGARLASLRPTIGRNVWTHQWSFSPQSIRQWERFVSSTRANVTPNSPVSSVTTIDVVKNLPKGRQELHDALTSLKARTGYYVNLSQVELALRGIGSEKAVIRIAILGVNGVASAAKLLKTILVDPLKPEEPWEKGLTEMAIGDGRGMLVGYGETYDYDARNPLLQTLRIPAAHLYQNEVEYLVLNFTPGAQDLPSDDKADNLLAPIVEIPNSTSGRVSMIRHPVHKALLYTEGARGLLTVATAVRTGRDGPISRAICTAITNNWDKKEFDTTPNIISMQLPTAEAAVAALRQSIENSTRYEQLWLDSRISHVTKWLEDGVHPGSQTIKPALENLIELVLQNVEQRLASEESDEFVNRQAHDMSSDTRQNLLKTVTLWAESSHTDLQYSLEAAFRGKYWTGLAWWKLPWHIDDVEMFLTHLVRNSWLVEPEKWMIYLGGRMNQAGIHVLALNSTAEELGSQLLQFEPPPVPKRDPMPESTEDSQAVPSTTDAMPQQISQWTQTISLARALITHTHFAPLQATGQRLLWQAYSLTALTSTLASLIYVSISSTSFYEAGAVAALGLVYGARRLQTRWERERTRLKWVLRQAGRSQIKRFEEEARKAIENGKENRIQSFGAQDREEARKAVEKARRALLELKNGDALA